MKTCKVCQESRIPDTSPNTWCGKCKYKKYKTKILAYNKTYNSLPENKEKIKTWVKNGLKKVPIEERRARAHQRYVENKDTLLAYQKVWRRENREKWNLICRRNAQRRRAAGNFNLDGWLAKIEEENFCKICMKSGEEVNLTIDHIIPISAGGTNELDNIQALCRPCNSRKGNKILTIAKGE